MNALERLTDAYEMDDPPEPDTCHLCDADLDPEFERGPACRRCTTGYSACCRPAGSGDFRRRGVVMADDGAIGREGWRENAVRAMEDGKE
jgi:hypothetical protein